MIAVTEDHCAPDPDWVRGVIDEHARNPDAAAIFGMVDNGSRKHLIDWALYGAGYLASAPPRPSARGQPEPRQPVVQGGRPSFGDRLGRSGARVSVYRRSATAGSEGARERPAAGHARPIDGPDDHVAALLPQRSLHRRRATRANDRQGLAADACARPVAIYRTLRTLNLARSRPNLRAVIFRSAPFIALLHALHASGESVGYITGPGRQRQLPALDGRTNDRPRHCPSPR